MLRLGAMMDAYVEHVRRTGRPASLVNTLGARRKLVSFFLARTPVEEIVTSGGLERYLEHQIKRGRRPATANHAVRYFRIAWQFCRDEKLPGFPPPLRDVKRVRMARLEWRKPSALTASELEALLEAAPTRRTRCAMGLAAFAGLRHQELIHLTLEDVDLASLVIRVRGKAGWVPKSHAEREIPIGPSLLPFAEEAVTGWRNECLDPHTKQFWIFQSWKGTRLANFEAETSATFRAIGIAKHRKPGLHMLRRTFATMLAIRGVPLPVIKDLMGHSSVVITEGYIAVPETALVEACEKL